ncbi:uncharacterized protein LOC112140197 isoform X2 [Oryzias melastigma]|uniref:uncharacterized protein LOC112140197 isoform X2 n=1 Tax=Oryzias melastigma TaxID=30732 RepID=UPI000CF7F565|nr:uncharacterized protein LOC112140197 isoform X2 [Oryzias melastigma]
MEAVVGLLLLLQGVAQGIESFCDSRQDKAQCYGADGGTVFIQLMNDASQTDVYEWKKDNFIILKGKKNKITANILENRSSFFFNNGTFMIKNLSKNDSGEYRLTLFDSKGQKTETRTTWLTVNEKNPLSILAVFLSLVVIFLIAVTVVFCVLKRKQKKVTDDQHIIYADVQMKQQKQKRRVSEKSDVDVEYSQVKFAERPRQTELTNHEAFNGDSS